MIRYLTGKEKLLTRDLWEEAFPEDSKEFDDYYFGEKLKDNRILALMETEGRVESMIHLNPYTLNVRGLLWKADYLVGVATRRDKRHQGFMRRLLLKMMEDMRNEQAPFCFLMPADEAIYRPFGFTYIYRQPLWRLRADAARCLERKPLIQREKPDAQPEEPETQTHESTNAQQKETGVQPQEAAEWLGGWLSSRYDMFAVRDEAYLKRLAAEIASENGTLELLYNQGKMVGVVSEWGWNEREQRLLYAERDYVEEAGAPKPAIMARIISPEVFVKAARLRQCDTRTEVKLTVKILDPLILQNNGVWDWTLNHETSWLNMSDAPDRRADLTLTITELTTWLCGYGIPEAAERFADVVEPLRHIFLDEVV